MKFHLREAARQSAGLPAGSAAYKGKNKAGIVCVTSVVTA